MMAAVVTIVYALFSLFEIISLKKTNKNKELIVFIIIMSIAYILSLLVVFEVKIPSMRRFIGDLIISITKPQ